MKLSSILLCHNKLAKTDLLFPLHGRISILRLFFNIFVIILIMLGGNFSSFNRILFSCTMKLVSGQWVPFAIIYFCFTCMTINMLLLGTQWGQRKPYNLPMPLSRMNEWFIGRQRTSNRTRRSQGRTLIHAPKKHKTSKLLTFNRHIKHIQTQQAPTINWLCISCAPTKTKTKKEQKTKILIQKAYKR